MLGYIKKIAVIKQLKGGFSADGGALSGIVKAETYAGFLKVDASLLNFAPLSEGRYLLGITDGENRVLFEGCSFEGETPFDLTFGFAAIVSFCVNGTISPVASAVSGQMAHALPSLKSHMEREELAKSKERGTVKTAEKATKPSADVGENNPYDDEAIAEDNYYEYKSDEDGDAVCAPCGEEEDGGATCKDETGARPVDGDEEPLGGRGAEDGRRVDDGGCGGVADAGKADCAETENTRGGEEQTRRIEFADGDFYSRMEGEIETIFSRYPPEERLMKAMSGSRWAKIGYGEGKYYVFGVLYSDGEAAYVCYGVPSSDGTHPPESLSGYATYMPVEDGGFWIMYQDAKTGVSIRINVS